MRQHDLVVLGTGPAGSSVARRCAKDGWKVAVVDAREPGGTCALRGCNPKKVLVHAAEVQDLARRSTGSLGTGPGFRIDWPTLAAFKREFTDPVPERTEKSFASSGIHFARGPGRFTSETVFELEDERLSAERFVIATGARPRRLDLPGEELVTSSEGFLELEELPRRIVFLGGGYISFEFAHVAARAGAEVTIVDHGTRPLKRFDPVLVAKLIERTRELGVTILTETRPERVCRSGTDGALELRCEGGRSFGCDLVVHGAGRTPALEGLDLEAAGIAFGERGVEVDGALRSTTQPRVLAAGDCAATDDPPLTPVANAHAEAIARNLLEGEDRHTPDVGCVPTVLFTVPALASVGLPVDEAQRSCGHVDVREGDMSGWNSVRKVSEPCAAYRLVIDPHSERLLGAHLVGPRAEETINLLAVAMRAGLTAGDLEAAPLAFPTFGHDLRSML